MFYIALGEADANAQPAQVAEGIAAGSVAAYGRNLFSLFAGFACDPVAPVEGEDNQLERCEEDDPRRVCFGVYGRYHEGAGELVCDTDTRAEAEALIAALEALRETPEARTAEAARLLKVRYGIGLEDTCEYDPTEPPLDFVERVGEKYDLDRVDVNSFTGAVMA